MKVWNVDNIVNMADTLDIPLGSAPSKDQLARFFWAAFDEGVKRERALHMTAEKLTPQPDGSLDISFRFDHHTTSTLVAFAVNTILDRELKPVADSEVKE